METKKKREKDTVPEVILDGTDNEAFFRQHYPVEHSGCPKPVMNVEAMSGLDNADSSSMKITNWTQAVSRTKGRIY